MASESITPKKRGRPAKVKDGATPAKTVEATVTPKAKPGRPKRQEKAAPTQDAITVEEAKDTAADEAKSVKANKSSPKATTKAAKTPEANKTSESPDETESIPESPQKEKEAPKKKSSSLAPKPKKFKAETKKSPVASKKEAQSEPLPTEEVMDDESKPVATPKKAAEKKTKEPAASTPRGSKTLSKKEKTVFLLEPVPTPKDISQWASKYKEGLSHQQKDFNADQKALATKVQAKLLKEGVSVSSNKILEGLDDFLFGAERISHSEFGIEVSTLWLLVAWRYLRGNCKAAVLRMVNGNDPQTLLNASKEIFADVSKTLAVFHSVKSSSDVFCSKHKETIKVWASRLSVLPGLSLVSATALLSLFTDEIPYMSEQGLMASLGSLDGSHKDATLLAYLEHVGTVVENAGGKVSARQVEAGWYYHSFEL